MMAALPVQYSLDGGSGSSQPPVNGGTPPLRRTMSPGGPGGFKARSRSSLSLVSHGDDRSGSNASDLAYQASQPQPASAADGQSSSSPGRRPGDAVLQHGSSSAGCLPQSAAGSAGASPSVSPSKRHHSSVRRLSPFAADACQDEVVATVGSARKDALEEESEEESEAEADAS